MNMPLGLMIEILVAALMVVMIIYCIRLNSRLRRLRTDEATFRSVIGELIAATHSAERAIEGLKLAADDCGESLAQRLQEAEQLSVNLAHHTDAGRMVLSRIAQITQAADMAQTKGGLHESDSGLGAKSQSRPRAKDILDNIPTKFGQDNRSKVA